MSNEELVSLIQQGVDVKKNLGVLYQQNEGFIRKIVRPLCEYAEADDLMQEAFFGIAKAVEQYDESQGVLFLTYATHKVRQSCIRYIENNSHLIRIPVHMQQRIRAYKKLCRKCDDIVDADTAMKELNLTQKQYDDMILTILGLESVSIESLVKEQSDRGTELTVGDMIADPSDIEQDYIEHELTELFWNCLDVLDDRSKEILLKRYQQEQTLKQIADDLGITKQRVSKLEQKALHQLKVINSVQEFAGLYDYDCGLAYHSGIRTFKETGMSGTEQLVLKRVELQEALKRKQKKLNDTLEVLQSNLTDSVTLDRINDLCEEAGIRISQMESESGLSSGSFSKWKKGFTPSQKSLVKVSQFFDVSVAYLIGDSDDKGHAEKEVSSEKIVNRIMTLCNVKGVTVQQMEKGSGLGAGSFHKWKKGNVPSQKSLKKVADYFNISVTQLQGV